jgi:hypothetical protein
VDGENPLFEYELNIMHVVSFLELGEKVVGISSWLQLENVVFEILNNIIIIDTAELCELI